MHATWAWSCVALAPLAACGDGGEPPSTTPALFTDSAGVAVVGNPPSGAVHAAVAPEPVLSIGAFDGPDEEIFGRIASVALDADGGFVVADGQAGEIRIFDAGGNHLRTLGGRGEGPGEFQFLAGAWSAAEGVVVAVDTRIERITRFGPEGGLLSTADFEAPSEGARASIRSARPGGPGALLSRVQTMELPSGEGVSVEDMLASVGAGREHWVRHDLAGAVIDTIAPIPVDESRHISAQGSGAEFAIQIMRVPFAPVPFAAASPEGRVVVSTGRSYEFSLHGPDGSLERIVRLAEEPPARTDAHLEAWVRRSTGGREPMDDAAVRAAVQRYEEMDLPERLPAWNALLVADGGEIWARRFAMPDAEMARWDVFAADGAFLGRVMVPAGFRVQHVAGGRLTVASADELGVERVEVHELR